MTRPCTHRFIGSRKSSEISAEMASRWPSRPMAARRVWAWAHVLRALAGEEMPLTRDTAGARHSGISRGGALYCRAKLVCAARRKCANTPCAAARSPLALRPLPPKGRRSFWFKGFPRAASGLYSPLPAQPTRAEGREGGLLDTISWLASPADGWLAFDFAFLLILI